MLQSTIMILIMTLSIIFCQMIHPLSIGLMLLIQTIMTCLLMGLMYHSFWFSYILFLVFIGGMLVLFIYMTSLVSNEMFSMTNNIMMISIIFLFFFCFFLSLIIDKTHLSLTMNQDTNAFMNKFYLMKENITNLNKIYNYPTNMISLLLINYLFFTLIIVVKITNFFYGPLRTM